MGSYSSFDGVIDFKTTEAFESFLAKMIHQKWYDPKSDSWIGDGGPIDADTDPKDKVPVILYGEGVQSIILPNYPIDNFHRLINQLESGSWEGEIRGTSDDGAFEGYIIHPDAPEEYFNLEDWAKENNLSLEWDEDSEDWLTEDRCDVMDAFIENPHPPTNSMNFIRGMYEQ